ncbi:hypothetical protein AAIH25_15320 [Arthrobacter crystallopoietes]|uniref:hypothetical protein n=1 Tax=Crystallibacter crystallopoietes TaxID=37928 RepID=UPI003D211C4B
MFSIRPKTFFPSDLAALSLEDLYTLAARLQEEMFRECNGRAGWARDQTLMRLALVDLELRFRQGEHAHRSGFL